MLRSRWVKAAVFLLGLTPAVWLLWRGLQQDLGVNPIETITRATGDWTLRFLLISLAVTPARRLLGVPDLIRFRRMLGLYAFFYGTLHLFTYLWLDKFFDPREIVDDVLKRRYITVGTLSWLLMLPLAITSTAGWIRRLGGKRWQALHRAAYVAAAAGVVHYWWLVKSDIRLPAMYGAILAALLALRVIRRRPAPARP